MRCPKRRHLQKLVKVVSLVLLLVTRRRCSEEVVTAYWFYRGLWQYPTKLQSLCFPFYSCYNLLRCQKGRAAKKSAQGKWGMKIQLVYFPLWLHQHAAGSIVSSCTYFQANLANKDSVFPLAFHLDMVTHSLSQKCDSIWLAEQC